MKIIFVGIHNKPGKKPLDSSTFTGKIVDQIIQQVKGDCIKMNLFDSDSLPKGEEAKRLKREFVISANFQECDIAVCFGSVVFNHLFELRPCKKIYAFHPSGIRYLRIKKDDYICDVVNKINQLIKENTCQ